MAFDILGSLGFGGSKEKGRSISEVNVPDWLMPFIKQMSGYGSRGLSNLSFMANQGGEGLVAPFDPLQMRGQNMAIDRMFGEGGFIPTAEQQFLQTAAGRSLGDILDPAAYQALTSMAGGDYSSLSDPARAALEAAAGGQGVGPGGEALAAHARGDYLYGGKGFDAALQAAMNRIQPEVQSRFGRAGAGAATGGLAQAAFNQGTSDAFAGLYDQNLNRQIGASNTLTGQALGAGQALGGFDAQDAARQMAAAGALGGYGMQERSNQMNAAAALPNLAMFAPGAMMDIGAQRQGLQQQMIDAPWLANMQLMNTIYGGVPSFAPLFGGTNTYDRSGRNWSGNFGLSFGG
jgi:hypothetical protein